jgi:O-antigen ligase
MPWSAMTENPRNTLLVLGAGALIVTLLTFERPQYLSDSSSLAIAIASQLMLLAVVKYRTAFFPVLISVFLIAGVHLPSQGVFLQARWLVLAVAAAVGAAIYLKDATHHFKTFHLVALFCILSAAVSAFVSQYPAESRLKAASLFLLFLYSLSGARLAVPAFHPERFFQRLLFGCEILVCITAVCYLALRVEILGNPNSLGALMGVVVIPVLLWGLLITETATRRIRLGVELAVATLLLMSSFARAGIGAAVLSSFLLCMCLRRYRFLTKALVAAFLIAVFALAFLPQSRNGPDMDPSGSIESAFLYKGHMSAGVFGSRKTVWQQTWSAIQENPWFGTGFGTSLISGDMTRMHYAANHIDSWVAREHGNSYLAIAEWTGLIGVLPFYVLIALTAINAGRVFTSLRRTGNAFSAAVPAATIVIAGLFHAMFEDWMFAVGYYLCVFFWAIAFIMMDVLPRRTVVYPPEMFVPAPARYAGAAASGQ